MLLNLEHKKYYTYNLKIKNIIIIENIDYKILDYLENIKNVNYLNLLLFSLKDEYIKINLDDKEKNELITKYIKQYFNDLKIDKDKLYIFINNNIIGIHNNYDTFTIETHEILNTISNIIYYCNLDMVKLVYTIIPELFNNNIKFLFNIGFYDYPNHNLLRSALDSLQYETINYLIKEHKFSFYKNIGKNDSIIFKKSKINITNLLEIIELDNINKYITDLSFNNYLDNIQRSNSDKITIKIFEQLCCDDRNKENIINLIISSIYNVKYKVIKNIFESKYFNNILNNFITDIEWIAFANNIHRFEDELIYNNVVNNFYNTKSTINNNINKSKIAYIVINKIYSLEKDKKEKILDVILYDYYDANFYCNIVRLPNIIKTLKIIHSSFSITNYSFLEKVMNSLLRYGYIDTIKYYFEELNVLDSLVNYNNCHTEFIDNSLYNKDNKVCEYVINKLYNPNLYIKYEFIKFYRIKQEHKIKKLKILNKYYDIIKDTNVILRAIFDYELEPYIKDNIKLVEWSISKLLNNKFKIENQFILLMIVQLCDLDILKKYLDMVEYEINIWELINKALFIGFCFYDYYIQYLIKIAEPLNKQCLSIKKEFYRNILKYEEKTLEYVKDTLNYDKEEVDRYKSYLTQDKYNNILKYCKQNGIDLNIDLTYLEPSVIISINYNGNEKMFKAAILMGISFKPLINIYEKKKLYNNFSNTKKKWIKLYYLIKHLEFRKKYNSKKIHNHIFTSSVVEIESKPPLLIENKPILKKGGHLFYKDLDEFDILIDNYKTFIKPIHIEPYQLYNLSKKEIYLSQKTDGILVKNIDKNDIYPPLDNKFNNIILDAEYIPELNLYLIFNQRSNYKETTDYLDDYYELYSQHNFCQDNINLYENIFKSLDDKNIIEQKLELELSNINNFIQMNHNQSKKLWYPKIFWKIEDYKRNLEVISIMENYLINYNLLSDKLIKNDGLIIMEANNKEIIYKYKPIEEMTADLQFKNEIWRCKWLKNKWEKYEIRNDKEYPNPKYVLDILEKYHNNPWDIKNIINYYIKYQDTIYYQGKFNNNNIYNKEYFSKYKCNLNNIYQKLISNKNEIKILDLGCGYLNNILWKNNNIIDGIDIDLGIIDRYKKLEGNNKRLFLGDISNINNKVLDNNLHNYYNKYTDLKNLRTDYNLIISNMSFHNVFKTENGFDNLMDFLNEKTISNCNMLITFIDKKLLFRSENYIDLLNGSYIKKLDDNRIKIYYSWTHEKPIIENILDYEFLENKMNKKGWIIKEYLSTKYININTNNPWNKVKNSIKIIAFIKK